MSKTLTRIAAAAATTAVAGTGLVLAATPAQAATSVWDKVAQCESSGNWHINTGNGYYGGLQFSRSTWNSFGGQKYAARADLASKEQQITVAQRVLAVQGPGAWPICSKKAGLTKANGGASYTTPTTPVATTPVVTTPAVKAVSTKANPVSTKSAKKTAPTAGVVYTVKPGDTLVKIARENGVSDWSALYSLNKAQIANPNVIYVGQHFVLG